MGSFLDDFGGLPPAQATAAQPSAPASPQGGSSFLDQFGGGGSQPSAGAPNPPPAAAPVPAAPKPEEPTPSWSEVPGQALHNLGHSAGEFASNVAQPFIHPVKTLEGIGNIGLGAMEKMGMYGSDEHKKYVDALGHMVMDRYGSVDNFKKTLAHDPVGVAADLSTVLTGGETALAKIPGMTKAAETAGTAASVINPINAVAKPAEWIGKGASKVGSEAIGVMTGTGGKPIEEAARTGFEGGTGAQAFRDNMRGNVPVESVVNDASSALANIRQQRGAEYRARMAELGLNNTVLDFTKLDDAFQKAGTVKTFKGQDLSPSTAAVRDKIDGIVNDWYGLPDIYHTPEGFDALKQKIGDVMENTEPHTPSRTVASLYYNAAKKTIEEQAPEYAKIMKGYSEASDIVKQIEKTLSVPSDARKGPTLDTSLRKLQSTLRNNVSSNYGYRAKLLEYLKNAGSPDLTAALSGQAMNSWAPRGLARLAAALGIGEEAIQKVGKAAVMLPVSSPRIVGEAAHLAGRIARPIKYLPSSNTAFQLGRATNLPTQARGGAVDRAIRIATKRKD